MVEVAAGTNAEQLTGFSYPLEGTYAGATFETGQPVRLDVSDGGTHYVHLTDVLAVGPVMVVPLVGAQRMRGALVIGRRRGRPSFDATDVDMATTFANHAALALELADARVDQERMLLLEDRDRIARDLHDHVIQQLFAAGLTTQSVASGLADRAAAERLNRVVSGIDDTIGQIRTTIFELRGPLGPQTATIRVRLLGVLDELAALLGFAPRIEFSGPVDSLVPEALVDDLVAVAREALTNVARHAHARRAQVTLTAGAGRIALEIADDGVGIGTTQRRSGLANLARRAARHGGRLEIESVTDTPNPTCSEGTQLTWTIPLNRLPP
jgi:signal transduction histidine kinase